MATVRPAAVLLGLALVAEAALFGVLLQYDGLRQHQHAVVLLVAAVPVWLLAVLMLSRLDLSGRRAGVLVLGVSAVFGLLALTHRPTTSDDDYRYMWDAKVQLAGTDPYRYPPSSPDLAHLRDPSVFGPPDHCAHAFPGGCTSINRPTVHTIYPPVAEASFDALRLASFGGHGGHLPLQIGGLLGSLAVAGLLLRRRKPWLTAVWAWCPVTIIEYSNNAHIDWLAVLLVVLALTRPTGIRIAGILAGAAIAVKLYPALVLPSLMRRGWTVAVVAVGFVALTYVPHVLAVGNAVIGYLPGYLREEQYGSGDRLRLLGAIAPHPVDTAIGAVLLAVVALLAWRRGSSDDPARSAVVVMGVALLIFTPSFGWYAGVLLALVVLTGAIEWAPVALAPSFAYLSPGSGQPWIWLSALVLTVAGLLARHRDELRPVLHRSEARAARP